MGSIIQKSAQCTHSATKTLTYVSEQFGVQGVQGIGTKEDRRDPGTAASAEARPSEFSATVSYKLVQVLGIAVDNLVLVINAAQT